ncbi:MAG: CPBP family intramembrane metalloprotease [Chlamydiales bacterium]|nr:CPBP family intramembrane metalloprotease [Chlamydiales bacterium]
MTVVEARTGWHQYGSESVEPLQSKVLNTVKSICIFYIATEAIRTVAIKTFSNMPDLFDEAIDSVVIAPVLEEILFRVILLDGIKAIQNAVFTHWHSRPATPAELQSQKVFRVWVTAIAFGIAHLGNYPGMSTAGKVAVTAWHILGGLIYGYLKEVADSASASLIYHSYHNYIVMCGKANILTSNQTFALIVIPRLVLLTLLTKGTEIKNALVSLPRKTVQVVKDINAFVKEAVIQVERTLFNKSSSPYPHLV